MPVDHGGGLPTSIHVYHLSPNRHLESALAENLPRNSFVILVGESTAGKSRAAYEAIRLFPDHRVIFPKDRNGLNAAVRVILSQRRSILWLDDLDRVLGPTGIDAYMVQRLLSGRRDAVIVASMRTQEHAKY